MAEVLGAEQLQVAQAVRQAIAPEVILVDSEEASDYSNTAFDKLLDEATASRLEDLAFEIRRKGKGKEIAAGQAISPEVIVVDSEEASNYSSTAFDKFLDEATASRLEDLAFIVRRKDKGKEKAVD